jgi:spore germination protein KC
MKLTVKILIIIIFLFNLTLLSGCWNYREIESLAIVSGVAIDKGQKEGNYLVTFEIVSFKGGGKEAKIESEKIESEGTTIFDASRNAVRISAKRLFWSHASVAIISQDIARKSIIEIADFINRDAEPREQMNMLISKEKTAKELLQQQSMTTEIRAYEMRDMIKNSTSLSKVPEAQIHDVINMLAGDGIALTLPAVGIIINQGKPTSELSGTAIFDKDKLMGFLSGEDSKYFLFVMNKIRGGLLTLKENPHDLNDDITLEIFGSKTKVTPMYSNGKISMNIEVHTKVSIGEVDISKNVIDEKGREAVKKDTEKKLKTNIENTIKKVQNDFGVDAFGFGSIIKKDKPKLWKSIGTNWNSLFKNIDTNVDVEIDIKESGLVSAPIKIGGNK